MGDFLAFRRMIATYFIQVIFWIGLLGIVAAFVGAISSDRAPVGFAILIFGALYWRILCEVFIVLFRMNDTLISIKGDTGGLSAALASRGGPPVAVDARMEEPAPLVGSGETVSSDKADDEQTPDAASVAPATPVAAAMPPEGWYDDSERPGHKRWWNGTGWGMRDDEHPSAR